MPSGGRCVTVAACCDERSYKTLPAAAAAMTAAAAEESPVKLGFDTYSLRAFKWKARNCWTTRPAEAGHDPVLGAGRLRTTGAAQPAKGEGPGARSSEFRSIAGWAASANRPSRSIRTDRRPASNCSKACTSSKAVGLEGDALLHGVERRPAGAAADRSPHGEHDQAVPVGARGGDGSGREDRAGESLRATCRRAK